MARRRDAVVRRGLRHVRRAIVEQPGMFSLAVAASSLYGAMTVASAYVIGEITDRVLLPSFAEGATTTAALTFASLAIIGVAVLKIVGILGRRLFAGIMSYRLQADYRRRVTGQYLRLPLSWHQRHPTGQLLSNANSDVEASWFFVAPLPFAVRCAGDDRDHRGGALPHRPADRAGRPGRVPRWCSPSTSCTRRS